MSTRRSFLGTLAGATAALPAFHPHAVRRLRDAAAAAGGRPAAELADDEAYWGEIRRAFDLDQTLVNLHNGGVSPTPSHVLAQMERDLRFANELPVEHMWGVLEPRIEQVRRELAREFGCDTEEMAITRNASEALETLIFGLDLKPGDEVIVTTQNYPRMLTAWETRARRHGIVLKRITFDVPPPSADYLVERFAQAMGPRTRVVEVTHITNLTGQIMPVRRIVDMARARGIETFVDGAHAFAQFPFTRDELGVDYYGTSLHKWLLAPVGTGFLYVRKAKQRALWPLMAAPAAMDEDVRKYEEIGTHPAANHNAIASALTFHRAIGAERKAARLRFLRDRWARRVQKEAPDRARILTPLDDPKQACGIGFVALTGVDPEKMTVWLRRKHGIVVTPITHAQFAGLRVTPNVYTTPAEVDLLAEKLVDGLKNGVA